MPQWSRDSPLGAHWAESPSDDGVDLAHGGGESESIDESSIELVQVVDGDLVGRAISLGREYLQIQFVPISTNCCWTENVFDGRQ